MRVMDAVVRLLIRIALIPCVRPLLLGLSRVELISLRFDAFFMRRCVRLDGVGILCGSKAVGSGVGVKLVGRGVLGQHVLLTHSLRHGCLSFAKETSKEPLAGCGCHCTRLILGFMGVAGVGGEGGVLLAVYAAGEEELDGNGAQGEESGDASQSGV
jgi:hypothetical protein